MFESRYKNNGFVKVTIESPSNMSHVYNELLTCCCFRYVLKGYDENYVAYWEAFGVPSFIVSMIVGATETFEVTKMKIVFQRFGCSRVFLSILGGVKGLRLNMEAKWNKTSMQETIIF